MANNFHVSLDEVINQLISNEVPNNKLILRSIEANSQPEYLTYKPISHYDDTVLLALAAAIEKNTTLECFDISNMDSFCAIRWTSIGAEAIGEAFKKHPTLKSVRIELQHFILSPGQILGFLNCLTGTAPIKELTSSFYCTDDYFLTQLAEQFKSNSTLESIYLQGLIGYSHTLYQDETLKNLAEGITQNKQLNRLSMYCLNLADKGISYLAEKLSTQHSLKYLTLSQCGLTGNNVAYLNHFFSAAKELTYLDLSYNHLNLEGIKNFTSQLPQLTNLHSLRLDSVGLDQGLALESLTTTLIDFNCPIMNLNISSQHFTVGDMSTINTFIAESRFIKTLIMSDCDLGDEHLLALKDTLANPNICHLERFHFRGEQPLSDSVNRTIVPILKANPHWCEFFPPQCFLEFKNVTDINQNKKRISQREFINGAITLAQGFFGTSTKKNNSSVFPFPKEVMLLILMKSGRHVSGLTPLHVYQCSLLILQNLEERAKLKNEQNGQEKSEVTPQKNLEIRTWWSQSTRDVAQQRLFTAVKPLNEVKEIPGTWCSIL